ncbi:MAG: Lipoate-protein ligase A, partial [uncultured Gemmatimonadetes bacterium]
QPAVRRVRSGRDPAPRHRRRPPAHRRAGRPAPSRAYVFGHRTGRSAGLAAAGVRRQQPRTRGRAAAHGHRRAFAARRAGPRAHPLPRPVLRAAGGGRGHGGGRQAGGKRTAAGAWDHPSARLAAHRRRPVAGAGADEGRRFGGAARAPRHAFRAAGTGAGVGRARRRAGRGMGRNRRRAAETRGVDRRRNARRGGAPEPLRESGMDLASL